MGSVLHEVVRNKIRSMEHRARQDERLLDAILYNAEGRGSAVFRCVRRFLVDVLVALIIILYLLARVAGRNVAATVFVAVCVWVTLGLAGYGWICVIAL
ncbi:conserved hypothetical pox protein [Squirrelpox virus]|uniref:Conserved hypothetical pox protein n=1 Tax=Squirrelpox virus TaxID=240426 RepID=U3UBC8_9POXV|nr:conserved hypothetical pox protein [Squirrelpox virus]CCD83238.1 conserved hypothetical pox protein [Squirrelpox virus]